MELHAQGQPIPVLLVTGTCSSARVRARQAPRLVLKAFIGLSPVAFLKCHNCDMPSRNHDQVAEEWPSASFVGTTFPHFLHSTYFFSVLTMHVSLLGPGMVE